MLNHKFQICSCPSYTHGLCLFTHAAGPYGGAYGPESGYPSYADGYGMRQVGLNVHGIFCYFLFVCATLFPAECLLLFFLNDFLYADWFCC